MRRRPLMLAALATVLSALAPAPEAEDGFVPLFDGKTTRGWEEVGEPGDWKVKDGLLVTLGKGGRWISTDRTYDNFVLRLEYRVGPGGNSGVNIRAPREGNPAYAGMEIQVLDDDHPMYKDLQPYQYTGSIYAVVAAKRGHTKPAGEWNAMEISADGPKIVVKLNGDTIVDANLNDHPEADKDHPGLKRKGGYIGLQSHTDPVEFRAIRLKELK